MKIKLWVMSSVSLAMATLTACSSVHKVGENEPTSVSRESKQIAAAESATYVTELSFERNSSNLDSGSRRKLDEILKRAKSSGRIDDIKVISWSDLEYPSEKRGKLSESQGRLAEHRADQIRDYLKKSDRSLDVHTFNMAKRPNSLARLFKTDDSRIKKSMENAGLDRERSDHVYPEKAGKSTVMVILEE
jgi:hypothetical protein